MKIFSRTTYGKILGGICSICGVVLLSIPIAFITSKYPEFYNLHKKRDRIRELMIRRKKTMSNVSSDVNTSPII
jgi:hypothetical protein